MNQRVNIREFNRLANIITKDLSGLPAEQLKEFNEKITELLKDYGLRLVVDHVITVAPVEKKEIVEEVKE
jgi:glutamate-1-semialdehyde aminotransferase